MNAMIAITAEDQLPEFHTDFYITLSSKGVAGGGGRGSWETGAWAPLSHNPNHFKPPMKWQRLLRATILSFGQLPWAPKFFKEIWLHSWWVPYPCHSVGISSTIDFNDNIGTNKLQDSNWRDSNSQCQYLLHHTYIFYWVFRKYV